MTPLLDWASSDILSSLKQIGFVGDQVSLLVRLWAENTSRKCNIAPVSEWLVSNWWLIDWLIVICMDKLRVLRGMFWTGNNCSTPKPNLQNGEVGLIVCSLLSPTEAEGILTLIIYGNRADLTQGVKWGELYYKQIQTQSQEETHKDLGDTTGTPQGHHTWRRLKKAKGKTHKKVEAKKRPSIHLLVAKKTVGALSYTCTHTKQRRLAACHSSHSFSQVIAIKCTKEATTNIWHFQALLDV